MTKKITKESLIAENAVLKDDNEAWKLANDRRRQEFAKAFGWYKTKGMYDYGDREPQTPTWEQIFVQVGKLLAARTLYDLDGNMSELECKLEDLARKLSANEELK